jgi:hypothetical protein
MMCCEFSSTLPKLTMGKARPGTITIFSVYLRPPITL